MNTLTAIAWILLKTAAFAIPYAIGAAVITLWLALKTRNAWRKVQVIRRVIRGEIDKELGR